MQQRKVALLGYGAMGKEIIKSCRLTPLGPQIQTVIVRRAACKETAYDLGSGIQVCSELPADTNLLIECAGHEVVKTTVLDALRSGVESAIVSSGALYDLQVAQGLEQAAIEGQTRLHLLSGAIGGIDALAAAQRIGLDSVVYVGRKPPNAWKGTDAERHINLTNLCGPVTFFSGNARMAAVAFPKNANVAATVSLAGIGFDRTQVRLIADPDITENTHEFHAKGKFGEIQIRMAIKPLASNPKTSALTVWSVVRFLHSVSFGLIV
ncbi:MAG: aspartate dehydrogenase [Burkholderiales bacterium]|jgi:aspartate dehydrogenase|nr:aspartate dehydrogenase [Burkholderiales bacterium]